MGLSKRVFSAFSLSLEDLQDDDILRNRNKLGTGELSSIAFAKKTRQAFLTDDQKARGIATSILGTEMVQTTPHILGWLFYSGFLLDSDLDTVIREHEDHKRPLAPYFRKVYVEALRIRTLDYLNPHRVSCLRRDKVRFINRRGL